jgi:hypothetical protein
MEKPSKIGKQPCFLEKEDTNMKPTPNSNSIYHIQKIKARMRQLIEHLREDVVKFTEPKAQALFETSAEVLTGLVKAFDDYEQKNEVAWQPKSTTPQRKGRTTHASRR